MPLPALAPLVPLAGKLLFGALAAHGLYSGGKDLLGGVADIGRGNFGQGAGRILSGGANAALSLIPGWGLGKGVFTGGKLLRSAGMLQTGNAAKRLAAGLRVAGTPIGKFTRDIGGKMLYPLAKPLGWVPGRGAKELVGSLGIGVGASVAGGMLGGGGNAATAYPGGINPAMPFANGMAQPLQSQSAAGTLLDIGAPNLTPFSQYVTPMQSQPQYPAGIYG